MSVTLNRDAFLASEPEIDVTQFKKVALDLQYADQSPNQILDVWYPDEGEGPYPCVILFHGGGFGTGHKRSFYISSMAMPVTQGYAVATVEYRLYNEAIWPAQLIDSKAAVRYLRAHAEELNLDPDKFAVWGNSAGGCGTQLLALTGDNEELDDLSVGEQASSKVQAAIAWYSVNEFVSCEQYTVDTTAMREASGSATGMVPKDARGKDSALTKVLGFNPLYHPEKAVKASPLSYVTPDCPPMLLQHGKADLIVDYHQSVYMYERIKQECGEGRARLDLFDGEPHGSRKIKDMKNVTKCIDFLDEVFYDGNNPYRKELKPLKVVGME
ncbi:MAG: alpha/beta hydrolase [Lachnospiraceae bacterium]|nr:alpha/beta hydrolase [Lachnospiraceae bacterium]